MTRTDARAWRPLIPDQAALAHLTRAGLVQLQDAGAPQLLTYLAAFPDPRAARGRRQLLVGRQRSGWVQPLGNRRNGDDEQANTAVQMVMGLGYPHDPGSRACLLIHPAHCGRPCFWVRRT